MTQPDTDRLSEMRAARLARLRVLELQQARYGNDTPPHIEVEIQEIKTDLALISAPKESKISSDVVEALGTEGRFQVLFHQNTQLFSRYSEVFFGLRDLQRLLEAVDARMDGLQTRSGVIDARLGAIDRRLMDMQTDARAWRLAFGVVVALLALILIVRGRRA